MKKKIIAVTVVAAILLILFLPIPTGTYRDGGTREYTALTYKIVVWNKRIAETDPDGSAGDVHTYHKTSFFRFPNNFKHIDELWEIENAGSDKTMKNEIGEIGRNTYVWEKEGFGGDFTITLQNDGTYSYYAGMLSSYIGSGKWTVNDGILTMTETTGYDRTFRFSVKDDALVFISEGSDKFMYVTVENGDRFIMDDSKNGPVVAIPSCVLVIEANDRIFYASLEDNSSAAALKEKLNSGPITVEMHDYGGFEKVGSLPWDLPRNDSQITAKPGDVILYQGDRITVYYDENSWNFTKLASVGSTTKEELLSALGEGDVSVKFSLEWGE